MEIWVNAAGDAPERGGKRMWLEHFLSAARNWQIFAVFIAIIVSAGLLLGLVVNRALRLTRLEIDQRTRDYAQIVYIGIFALTALMMSLSTLEARTATAKLGGKVKEEAFNLVHLDRMLVHYGEERTAEARRILVDYAKAVVEEDWPLMRAGAPDGSDRVYDLMARLRAAISVLPEGHNSLADRMLDAVNDLEQDHDDRIIAASETRLLSIFWWLIGALIAVICVLAGLLIVRPYGFVFLGIKLTAIGLMVSFLAVLDGPFRGEISISPEAISYAIAELSAK